jgi:UDP-N-acetylmuramate dehydrogenase
VRDVTDPAAGRPVLLADHTTLGLGGPAGQFVVAHGEAELVQTISRADAAGTPTLVIGGGSNLVVADEGFDGLVV